MSDRIERLEFDTPHGRKRFVSAEAYEAQAAEIAVLKERSDEVEKANVLLGEALVKSTEEVEKWKRAFGAQSQKLQAVIDIEGVREALAVVMRK